VDVGYSGLENWLQKAIPEKFLLFGGFNLTSWEFFFFGQLFNKFPAKYF